MNYTLMHKDIEVAKIALGGRVASVTKIITPDHLPVACNNPSFTEVSLNHNLNLWNQSRVIPPDSSRGIKLHSHINDISIHAIKNLGVSLTDCYWYRPDGADLKWKDVNFFKNGFSHDVGEFIFLNKYTDKLLTTVSPDITTNGMLNKMWIQTPSGFYLVKDSGKDAIDSDIPYESLVEVVCSNIFKDMNINAVEYRLSEVPGISHVLCSCKNFVRDDNYEFVPLKDISVSTNLHGYDLLYYYRDLLQSIGSYDEFKKSVIGDYLIGNCDRHSQNIGVLRNPDTLQFLSAAPSFDFGGSLPLDFEKMRPKDIRSKLFNIDYPDLIRAVGVKKFAESFNAVSIHDILCGVLNDFLPQDSINSILNSICERKQSFEHIIDGDDRDEI
ncbi:MAG: hypothetical protein II399_00330 [Lachnospiraceae bacterium]|nr:hypothetical protein [Lachnospiraceae bacterium]